MATHEINFLQNERRQSNTNSSSSSRNRFAWVKRLMQGQNKTNNHHHHHQSNHHSTGNNDSTIVAVPKNSNHLINNSSSNSRTNGINRRDKHLNGNNSNNNLHNNNDANNVSYMNNFQNQQYSAQIGNYNDECDNTLTNNLNQIHSNGNHNEIKPRNYSDSSVEQPKTSHRGHIKKTKSNTQHELQTSSQQQQQPRILQQNDNNSNGTNDNINQNNYNFNNQIQNQTPTSNHHQSSRASAISDKISLKSTQANSTTNDKESIHTTLRFDETNSQIHRISYNNYINNYNNDYSSSLIGERSTINTDQISNSDRITNYSEDNISTIPLKSIISRQSTKNPSILSEVNNTDHYDQNTGKTSITS
ncbi:hypothetical protein KGF54_000296 [Candida jiufengensis]|uniref:uncharacterized protein n=1 Tax=Candida jiufengensis TaxID=497108 RepID=UPI0022244FB9|nr:uncharacterized protein KGF54_000296 [Candida jiufengensis]KAI5957368.1 hypothetical protein KGF54_000296 [Candida jiufengensis]